MFPAVFITARFRTGSTMLWNIFRQIPEVVAYYEPLHEKLPQWIISGKPPQPSHDLVDTYFREYPPVEELRQYHLTEFGVCRLYLEAGEPYPQLKHYIQYLIDLTPADHIPVLQFNRVNFRLPWLKANFPDVPIIHLYRSPRDQWCSSISQYPEDVDKDLDADPVLITTWARDLCQQFPFLARPYIRHAYQRYYFLWKLSYLLGSRLAEISVAYEDILQHPEATISRLLHLTGLESQDNLKSCTSVILQKSVDRWKQYRREEWFAELEQDCELILKNLDLSQYIGGKPLSEIIAENREYQQCIADPQVYAWALQNGQVSIIHQKLISEEKEKVIWEIHTAAEERLELIHQMELHPLRLVLKRYLPQPIQQMIRQIRQVFHPKLGQLQQYSPVHVEIQKQLSAPMLVFSQSLPIVSVVTPSRNRAQFLERTLKSVLGQNYPKLEYIVQDGASTDETRQILEQYRSQLTYTESCKDAGQANALNRGFRHATGDIMAWLNSDDLLLPGTVRYIVNFFLEHPEVDIVYGHRIIINEDDLEIGRWILPPHDDAMLRWADYVPQETLFWHRRIWEKSGGYVDEAFHFALDWELLLRFREAGATFRRLPRFLSAFRVHPDQKTSQHLEGLGFQEMSRLRKQIHGRDVSNQEALAKLRLYMVKHLIYTWLYRWNLLF